MTLKVKTSGGDYKIHIERGLLQHAGEMINLERKVLVITDTGVPEEYAMTVASQCAEAVVFVFEQGELSKNMDTYTGILQTLTENEFTRTDCVVAVGGGVVGDMAGFAAATYMRGLDFYNVPTTVLSQVDSSVGGKTAIDFMGYKNLVGAFYPPKAVLIDPEVLRTLPQRQVSNGLAEAIKMALTHSSELFELLENKDLDDTLLEEIICRAIQIKKQVVEADEYEAGQRKVLNFGHTLGHGIEAVTNLYHGECVALGMLPMCSEAIRPRLIKVLERLNLPTTVVCNAGAVTEACHHDKKLSADTVTLVFVPAIGEYELKTIPLQEFEQTIQEVLEL
ncbi:MAG: 3-dehydroquinate synthase [Ruminococcaceae bacterium]|nr:3-dehydroquinate synthase [Oscillospiraceae bacterium]